MQDQKLHHAVFGLPDVQGHTQASQATPEVTTSSRPLTVQEARCPDEFSQLDPRFSVTGPGNQLLWRVRNRCKLRLPGLPGLYINSLVIHQWQEVCFRMAAAGPAF